MNMNLHQKLNELEELEQRRKEWETVQPRIIDSRLVTHIKVNLIPEKTVLFLLNIKASFPMTLSN